MFKMKIIFLTNLNVVEKEYPNRKNQLLSLKNILNSLVNAENMQLPPLYIKLGLMKQFVKALSNDRTNFLVCLKLN